MNTSKRVLCIALDLVLLASVFAFADNEESDYLDKDNYIKLGLYYGTTNYASSITINSDYGFNVYEESSGVLVNHIDDTSISFDLSDSDVSGYIYMSAAEDPDSRLITMKTDRDSSFKTYRDGIYLIFRNGFRVINYLTLEHYVWGIVNREMSSRNPEEALRAQAIAARTYALYIKNNSSSHSSMGFDLCSTTHCQVYGGVASENSVTTQACKDTEGLIMTYDGEAIYAVFSANSGGGYTMSVYDAWGIDMEKHPYLQSVEDPYTPEHRWETTYLFSELADRLKTKLGLDIGDIVKVEVSDTNSFGAVTGLLLTGTNGQKRIPRSQIMSTFNLKSTFFCIGNDGYNEITKAEATPEYTYVLTTNGVQQVASSLLYIYNGSTTSKMAITKANSYSMTNDVCTDGYCYMRGIGFGHGIGMSQNGAITMARDYGMTYDQILNFYYTDITIENYR